MKISNKALLTSAFLAALFVSQTAMANPEGSHDEYNTIHSKPSLITESPQTVDNSEKQRANYLLEERAKETSINSDLFGDGNR